MGHVTVKLKIINVQTQKYVEETAIVDTGATFTVIPRKLATDLGLSIIGKQKVKTAQAVIELDESYAKVAVNGKSSVSPIIISDSPTIEKPLVGVITLESLGLAVDPSSGKLKETEALLMCFASIA